MYTTTRTHNNASCVSPQFDPIIRCLVNESMSKVTPVVTKDTNIAHDWAITILICGNTDKLTGTVTLDEEKLSKALDVYIHVGSYIPMIFGTNGAQLALVGRGRIIAAAKHSDWLRGRKYVEQLRPPSVNELLLSNDGDHILEGSVTDFFVVTQRSMLGKGNTGQRSCTFVVDARMAGRGLCHKSTSLFKERSLMALTILILMIMVAVAAGSLRLLQHVESAPNNWDPSESRSWNEIEWEEKLLKEEVMVKAFSDGYSMTRKLWCVTTSRQWESTCMYPTED
ncbi:hypothetical protein CRG98_036367 [Punica granatum]|uniref:Uncharacterized protein n=1 Tax=Punica granatum TaxID=22663 RepID=A0A2I0IGZ5_PUNGR|nr:hypothetical protein CRG98_036367 [Punica granatum]